MTSTIAVFLVLASFAAGFGLGSSMASWRWTRFLMTGLPPSSMLPGLGGAPTIATSAPRSSPMPIPEPVIQTGIERLMTMAKELNMPLSPEEAREQVEAMIRGEEFGSPAG